MTYRPRTHAAEVLGFVPAELHINKEIYVDCYALHPATGRLKRKRYRLNHVRGAAKRKTHGRHFCEVLNQKLRSGWNPWITPMMVKKLPNLSEACAEFVEEKNSTTKNRSPNSYRSHIKRLLGWCKKQGLDTAPVSAFTPEVAKRYMRWIRDENNLKVATFNNYRLYAATIFNWMVAQGYTDASPMKGVKKIRDEQKLRTLITVEERKACMDWFAVHRPAMVTVCMWVFHTLLRPRSELMRIRAGDVDLVNGVVNVSGSDTKSKRVRRPAIMPEMLEHLKTTSLVHAAKTDYVVGKGLLPGPLPSGYNYIGICWNDMRKALNWGPEKQLYSLRDSGIVQLIADGVELQVVMRQADHQNIETTNRYVQHFFHSQNDQVRSKASSMTGPSQENDPER